MVIAAQALCEGELRVMVGVRELEGLEMELQASERILRGLREQVTHWELGQLRVRERKVEYGRGGHGESERGGGRGCGEG